MYKNLNYSVTELTISKGHDFSDTDIMSGAGKKFSVRKNKEDAGYDILFSGSKIGSVEKAFLSGRSSYVLRINDIYHETPFGQLIKLLITEFVLIAEAKHNPRIVEANKLKLKTIRSELATIQQYGLASLFMPFHSFKTGQQLVTSRQEFKALFSNNVIKTATITPFNIIEFLGVEGVIKEALETFLNSNNSHKNYLSDCANAVIIPGKVSLKLNMGMLSRIVSNRKTLEFAVYDLLRFDVFPSVIDVGIFDELDTGIRKRLYDLALDKRLNKVDMRFQYQSIVHVFDGFPYAQGFLSRAIIPKDARQGFDNPGVSNFEKIVLNNQRNGDVLDTRFVTLSNIDQDRLKNELIELVHCIFVILDDTIKITLDDATAEPVIVVDVYNSAILQYFFSCFSRKRYER